MKTILSTEQRQAIHQIGALPLEIADPETNQVFYLISAEQHQKLLQVLSGIEEIDPSFYEFDDVKATDAS